MSRYDCGDIFSGYIAYLGQSVTDPVNIASDLFQNGVIPSPVKERAEINANPAGERTAQLFTAVHKAIRGDFQAPNMFLRTIDVLRNHTETRAIAIKMKSDYDGENGEYVDNDNREVSGVRQRPIAAVPPPPQRHGRVEGASSGGGSLGDGSYPPVMTSAAQGDHSDSGSSAVQPTAVQDDNSPLEISLLGNRVVVPPTMITSVGRWIDNHPCLTTAIFIFAAMGTGLYLYRKFF